MNDPARLESWYRHDADRGLLTLVLHVQPNARRTEVAGVHGGRLKVRVAAPAVDGKANNLLVGFLAGKFDLPVARVMIRRGSHGRTKIVEIHGTVELHGRAASLLARVKELPHS